MKRSTSAPSEAVARPLVGTAIRCVVICHSPFSRRGKQRNHYRSANSCIESAVDFKSAIGKALSHIDEVRQLSLSQCHYHAGCGRTESFIRFENSLYGC